MGPSPNGPRPTRRRHYPSANSATNRRANAWRRCRLPGLSRCAKPLCWAILFLAGCSASPQPRFQLNTEGRDPKTISATQAAALQQALAELFGTPDQPVAAPQSGLTIERLHTAAGPVGSDADGHSWGLYRKYCALCHGISGDGAGPAAVVQSPYPRDYRSGVFKYTSTASGAKPADDDLLRLLRRGVPGTSMPSFSTLPNQEVEALIEYIKYLSVRGETEQYLLQLVVDEDETIIDLQSVIDNALRPVAQAWKTAQERIVTPPPPLTRQSADQLALAVARGRELFLAPRAKCTDCHGPQGRGDGPQAANLYDDWNKRKKGDTPEETQNLAARFQLPIQRLRPRNFTEGVFRGGERPIDIFWRIHVGIKGTPMPAAGPATGSAGALQPSEIWDLAHYVRSLAHKRESTLAQDVAPTPQRVARTSAENGSICRLSGPKGDPHKGCLSPSSLPGDLATRTPQP